MIEGVLAAEEAEMTELQVTTGAMRGKNIAVAHPCLERKNVAADEMSAEEIEMGVEMVAILPKVCMAVKILALLLID